MKDCQLFENKAKGKKYSDIKVRLSFAFCLLPFTFCLLFCRPSIALPPPEDLPEEVLRTQIITEARSPIDGKSLTAAEYAELKARLAESPFAPEVNQKLRDLIVLLRLRQLFKTFTPF